MLMMVVLDERTKIYQQNKLTFILTPTEILVRTTLNQSFFLLADNPYMKTKLKTIRKVIELGEIKNLNELAGWTRPHIIWTSTQCNFDLTNCEYCDTKETI